MKEFVECIQKYSNLNQLSVDLMESKVELKVIKKGQYFLKAGKKVSLVLDRYRKIIPHLNNAGLYKFFNYSVNEALFLSDGPKPAKKQQAARCPNIIIILLLPSELTFAAK